MAGRYLWANGTSDTYALGVLAEMTGMDTPIVALPFVNSALASRIAFQRSVETLRGEGVHILLGPDLAYLINRPPIPASVLMTAVADARMVARLEFKIGRSFTIITDLHALAMTNTAMIATAAAVTLKGMRTMKRCGTS